MMQRKTFIRNTSLVALSLGAFGKLLAKGNQYTGDRPTTTDILGPAYRPGAPLRTNINPAGFKGLPLHITGTVYQSDGKTAFDNCTIDVWQCLPDGTYDMLSDDFVYRGQLKTDKNGAYHLITTHPVAYTIDKKKTVFRAEHIHLRVVGGQGEQDLITQIYFKGDQYIKGDHYASSPRSANRILETKKNNRGEDQIGFDIYMQKEFPLDEAAYDKITGVYRMDDHTTARLFHRGDLLYMETDEMIDEAYMYKGGNQFRSGAEDPLQFEFSADGKTRLTGTYTDLANQISRFSGVRIAKYDG